MSCARQTHGSKQSWQPWLWQVRPLSFRDHCLRLLLLPAVVVVDNNCFVATRVKAGPLAQGRAGGCLWLGLALVGFGGSVLVVGWLVGGYRSVGWLLVDKQLGWLAGWFGRPVRPGSWSLGCSVGRLGLVCRFVGWLAGWQWLVA